MKKQFLFAGLMAFCSADFINPSTSDVHTESRQDSAQDTKESTQSSNESLQGEVSSDTNDR